jgi:hypothetical protein
MNITEIFKVQIEKGATEMFLYGVEMPDQGHMQQVASIRWHKGALDSFPTNLEFVRMMGENTSTPLFREV